MLDAFKALVLNFLQRQPKLSHHAISIVDGKILSHEPEDSFLPDEIIDLTSHKLPTPSSPQNESLKIVDGAIVVDPTFGGTWHMLNGFRRYIPSGKYAAYEPDAISEPSPAQIDEEIAQLAAIEPDEPEPATPPIESVKLTQPLATRPDLSNAPRSEPPPPPKIECHAAYLRDGNSADFDDYLAYLEPKYSKSVIAERGTDLRFLRKTFKESELTAVAILKACLNFERLRQIRIRTTFFDYGQFRLLRGDASFAAIAAELTQITIEDHAEEHLLHPKKPDEGKLTERQAVLYHAMAKTLCDEGKRDGIWIELLLLGVKVSHIKTCELKQGNVISNQKTFAVPDWCRAAMRQIDDKSWRLDRKSIHREIAHYEVHPSLLNSAVRFNDHHTK